MKFVPSDFARLMQGDVILADLDDDRQERIKKQVEGSEESLLNTIKDPYTRETMKKWARYFPK